MAIIHGGAPKDQPHEEEFEFIANVLEDDLGLIKRKFVLSLKSLSGAKIKEELRQLELVPYSEAVRTLVAGQDWEALAALPSVKSTDSGLYLHLNWAADRTHFALQAIEPRPWEGGRYARTTPVVVFTEDDAPRVAALFLDGPGRR